MKQQETVKIFKIARNIIKLNSAINFELTSNFQIARHNSQILHLHSPFIVEFTHRQLIGENLIAN